MKKNAKLIYLDNNATTRVDPEVFHAMLPWLQDAYGNPSSVYGIGRQAAKAVKSAREKVAALMHCRPEDLIFTSCGSESINTAIRSAIGYDPDRNHVISTTVEHSASLKLCERLAERGYEITLLPVDAQGHLDLEMLKSAIREETAIVSLLWANNETGVLFPVEKIAEICQEKKVPLHIDAVQALGKQPIDLEHLSVSFLSVSGHKLHCPKGIGALYINPRTRFSPWLIGGSQENGRRGGTENVAFITGFGKAAELAAQELTGEIGYLKKLRDRLEQKILSEISTATINGDPENRLPNTSNIRFPGIESEAALVLFDKAGLCCSAGSACTSGSVNPSHVLTAMGLSRDDARSSLRFSLSRFTTEEEIEEAGGIIVESIRKLQEISGK